MRQGSTAPFVGNQSVVMEPPSAVQPVRTPIKGEIRFIPSNFEIGFDGQPLPLKGNPDEKVRLPCLACTPWFLVVTRPRVLGTSQSWWF